jgi:hypothetical protein
MKTIHFLRRAATLGAIFLYAALLAATNTHAADAACAAMIKQTLPRPELPYRVEQEMKIDGKILKSKAVYIEGHMHVQSESGKWIRTQKPVDPKAVEALALETTRECKITGSDVLNGMKMNVWTVKSVTPFEKGVSTSRTWIGATDGRTYRQVTDELDQRIFYDNVVKPEIEAPRAKRAKG